MKKTILSAFACSLLLIGCGNNSSSNSTPKQNVNPQNQNAKLDDLSSKTTNEILALKYNKAILTCSLWSQRGKSINLNLSPNDSATLDLKGNLELPHILELNASVEGHQVSVQFEVTKISHYELLNHTDTKGNKVAAQYSPYAQMNYSSEFTTADGEELLNSGSDSDERIANERIQDIALNRSLLSQPIDQTGVTVERGAFNDYASCVIETDIKSDYSNQFNYTPAKQK